MRKVSYSHFNIREMRKGQLDYLFSNRKLLKNKENKSTKFYKEKKLTNNIKHKVIFPNNNGKNIIYSKL